MQPSLPDRRPLVNPAWTVSHRVRRFGVCRACLIFAYYAVAIRLPMPGMPGGRLGHWLRGALARRLLKRCGANVRIAAGARFGSGMNLEIGDNSGLGDRAWLLGEVSIGDNVMMGPDVAILAYNHAFDDTTRPMDQQGAAAPRPVRIGDDVWIGMRAMILPGVTIGSHAVVGAGSVVTRDVPEWAVAAGNPARVVRYRRAGAGAEPPRAPTPPPGGDVA